MREIITKENRAVVITQNADGGTVRASLYVNARNGIENADITLINWKGNTIAGARKWAEKQLNA